MARRPLTRPACRAVGLSVQVRATHEGAAACRTRTRTPRSTAAPARRALAAIAVGATLGVVVPMLPASAVPVAGAGVDQKVEQESVDHAVEQECFEPGAELATTARGCQLADHRDVSPAQVRAIEARTERILAGRSAAERRATALAASVPVSSA